MFFETYYSNYSPHPQVSTSMRTRVPGFSRCQSLPKGQVPQQTGSLECGLVSREVALSHLSTAQEPSGVKESNLVGGRLEVSS